MHVPLSTGQMKPAYRTRNLNKRPTRTQWSIPEPSLVRPPYSAATDARVATTPKLANFLRRTAAQLLRLVPGSAALALKRDVRDTAWLDDADAVVISYPKSGRTFVRAMLARLFQRRFGVDERDLLEFPILKRAASGVPRVLFTHAGDAMRPPPQVDIIPAMYAGKKLALIARHPGDIAVSRYYHLRHRSRDKARRQLAEQPLASFIWADRGGIPSIVAFLNQFAALAHSRPGVTIVRFEDFLAQPEATLRKLAKGIGLKVARSDISDAVAFASLANLRQLELDGYFRSSRLRPAKTGDHKSGKVRSGGSGGYREQLGEAEAARIDEYLAANLAPVFRYGSAAEPRPRPKRRSRQP